MAVALVNCKCEVCGKEFTHKHNCTNRSEAERYEEWAVDNITVCPECYRKEQRELAIAEEEKYCNKVEMPYYKYKNDFFDCKTVPDSYNKETKTIIVFVPTEEEKVARKMTETMPFPTIKEARIAYSISNKYSIDYKIVLNLLGKDKEKLKEGLKTDNRLNEVQKNIVRDVIAALEG